MKHPRVQRSSENRFSTFSYLWLRFRQLGTETTLHESKEDMVRVSEEPFLGSALYQATPDQWDIGYGNL